MKFKNILFRIGILFLGLCLGLITVEIWLHVADAGHEFAVAKDGKSKMGQDDPLLGWRMRPGEYRQKTNEWEATYKINAEGMNDADPLPPPPGTRIIIALGNSHTMATGINVNQTWPKVLQRTLNQDEPGHANWRVMNFGVGAYSIGQSALHLMRDGLKFHPKTVILAFTLTSDLYVILPPGKGGFFYIPDKGRAYFDLTPEGKLFLNKTLAGKTIPRPNDSTWQERFKNFLEGSSKLYPRLKRSRLAMTVFRHLGSAGRHLWPNMEYLSDDLNPNERFAWDLTEAILAHVHEELKARNIRFIVAVLPYYPQVYDSVWNEAFGTDPHYDRFAANRRILGICKKHGIACVDLTNVLHAHASHGEILHYRVDGHLNPLGQSVVGNALKKTVTHASAREIETRPRT